MEEKLELLKAGKEMMDAYQPKVDAKMKAMQEETDTNQAKADTSMQTKQPASLFRFSGVMSQCNC
jgi:hypothetical protein